MFLRAVVMFTVELGSCGVLTLDVVFFGDVGFFHFDGVLLQQQLRGQRLFRILGNQIQGRDVIDH